MTKISILFFNNTATTKIYTLSLHDALPISIIESERDHLLIEQQQQFLNQLSIQDGKEKKEKEKQLLKDKEERSEEHTSELQSRQYLVCRLLLEKKKTKRTYMIVETNRSIRS